jgi:hypothetical protein
MLRSPRRRFVTCDLQTSKARPPTAASAPPTALRKLRPQVISLRDTEGRHRLSKMGRRDRQDRIPLTRPRTDPSHGWRLLGASSGQTVGTSRAHRVGHRGKSTCVTFRPSSSFVECRDAGNVATVASWETTCPGFYQKINSEDISALAIVGVQLLNSRLSTRIGGPWPLVV